MIKLTEQMIAAHDELKAEEQKLATQISDAAAADKQRDELESLELAGALDSAERKRLAAVVEAGNSARRKIGVLERDLIPLKKAKLRAATELARKAELSSMEALVGSTLTERTACMNETCEIVKTLAKNLARLGFLESANLAYPHALFMNVREVFDNTRFHTAIRLDGDNAQFMQTIASNFATSKRELSAAGAVAEDVNNLKSIPIEDLVKQLFPK